MKNSFSLSVCIAYIPVKTTETRIYGCYKNIFLDIDTNGRLKGCPRWMSCISSLSSSVSLHVAYQQRHVEFESHQTWQVCSNSLLVETDCWRFVVLFRQSVILLYRKIDCLDIAKRAYCGVKKTNINISIIQ